MDSFPFDAIAKKCRVSDWESGIVESLKNYTPVAIWGLWEKTQSSPRGHDLQRICHRSRGDSFGNVSHRLDFITSPEAHSVNRNLTIRQLSSAAKGKTYGE